MTNADCAINGDLIVSRNGVTKGDILVAASPCPDWYRPCVKTQLIFLASISRREP